MTQTVLMAAAAIQLVAIACLFRPQRLFHIIMFQFIPSLLALGLTCCAFGRFMGWPI